MYDAPPKMSTKKKIEIIILIFLIIWGIFFAINYYRYSKGEHPILALKTVKEYPDGSVTEYISLGYIYRSYNRNAITKEEFVPFWVPRENPEAKNALPDTYKDYDVPKNIEHLDKYKGLLYYYDGGNLIGTYKCINTEKDCNKGFSGYDEYNTQNAEPLTALKEQPNIEIYKKRFAFVDDSYEQDVEYGDKQYIRTVYLLDVVENEIIAKYEDVKMHYYEDDLGYINDNGDFIVRSDENRKWGVMNLNEDGEIKEVIPFEYDSITYDLDTGYYIMMKDASWYIYDLKNDKKISSDVIDPIYDVWENSNMSFYYKTGITKNVGDKKVINYKVYKLDGSPFLVQDNILNMFEQETWVMYLSGNDKKLHFVDYSGEEKITPVQLNFTEMTYDKMHHPAFEMRLGTSGYLSLKIYRGPELKDDYDEVSFSTKIWN